MIITKPNCVTRASEADTVFHYLNLTKSTIKTLSLQNGYFNRPLHISSSCRTAAIYPLGYIT